MNLHHDHEAFSELIIAASNGLHMPPGIIEKDYSEDVPNESSKW